MTLAVDTNRLSDVVAAMTGVGLKPLVDPESFTRKTMVLPCADTGSGIRVDLIFSYSPYERQAVERAQSIRIGGSDVRFASVEDLVIHKVLAGRPRDIEDVVGVVRRNPTADLASIRFVLAEFAAATGEPLIDRLEYALKRCR